VSTKTVSTSKKPKTPSQTKYIPTTMPAVTSIKMADQVEGIIYQLWVLGVIMDLKWE